MGKYSILSTKIKTKKRLAVVQGAGQIERLEWRVYLVVLAFLMFCTWLTLLVISASTFFFLLMWEPSTSVCSLFKITSEFAGVGFFFRLNRGSSNGW